MLQPKQKAFADYYIQTLNASESYKRAYPSTKKDSAARTNSSRLLNKPEIQAYIGAKMADKDEDRIASGNEILEFLTAQMRSDIVQDKERIRCAELLGKRHRLFVDKVEANVTQTVIFEGENELED